MSRAALAVLALLAVSPAAGQEWQVARDRFAFAGHRLTIRIDAEAGGTLHLIRGAAGSVAVAGRAGQGFVSSGLTHDEELTLSAVGPGPVQFMVSVPADVWVSVRLPGRPLPHAVGGRTASQSFEWPSATAAPPVAEWTPAGTAADGAVPPLFTAFARGSAPARLDVPDLSNVRRLSVRIEGLQLRIDGSRPLSVEQRELDRFVLGPVDRPTDIVIILPRDTDRFLLRAGGAAALRVDGALVTSLCEPVTEQWLSDGRRWLTFNPRDGILLCSEETVRRHEG